MSPGLRFKFSLKGILKEKLTTHVHHHHNNTPLSMILNYMYMQIYIHRTCTYIIMLPLKISIFARAQDLMISYWSSTRGKTADS